MSRGKDKYSLWIVPKGEAGMAVQALVDKLADKYEAPRFVPHLTLVANIFATPEELTDLAERARKCIEAIGPFTVGLDGYGYTEEEFRSLYMLADADSLRSVYESLVAQFPQVRTEHFQAMPHMSVLYGIYPRSVKDDIVASNPMPVAEFVVEDFDLYLTNNPVKSWRLTQSFPLR